MTYDELVETYEGRRNVDMIVEPDYVTSPNISLSEQIKERSDYIVACHVIEHIPNLIAWLNEINLLLDTRGRLFLAVPDKR